MDKLAYHLNKKKKPAKTEGKFLYYYPCNSKGKPNFHIGDKKYIEIEVTGKEREALRELDMFEYNNEHKAYRHKESFPEDDERLSRREQKKWTDKNIPFSTISNERLDRIRVLGSLTPQERTVYCCAIDDDMKQKEIAEELGITQGAVSATFNRARRKLDAFDLSADNTPDDIVWKLWQIFMRDMSCRTFLMLKLNLS